MITKLINIHLIATLLLVVLSSSGNSQTLHELEPMSLWKKEINPNTNSCDFIRYYENSYDLKIQYNYGRTSPKLFIMMADQSFIEGEIYEVEMYIGYETIIESQANAIKTNRLSVTLPEFNVLEKAFEGAQEFGLSVGEELFVFKMNNDFISSEMLGACDIAMDMEQDINENTQNVVTSEIASPFQFQQPERDNTASLNVDDAIILNAQSMGYVVSNPSPLDADASPLAADVAPLAVDVAPLAADVAPLHPIEEKLEARQVSQILPSRKPLSSSNHFNKTILDRLADENVTVAQSPVDRRIENEILKMRPEEYPESLQGIDQYITDGDNVKEAKILIESLMRKLNILEREKEALRNKIPEQTGPLSVIRTCSNERETIENISSRLSELNKENSDLRRLNNVKEDQLASCQITATDEANFPDVAGDGSFNINEQDVENVSEDNNQGQNSIVE